MRFAFHWCLLITFATLAPLGCSAEPTVPTPVPNTGSDVTFDEGPELLMLLGDARTVRFHAKGPDTVHVWLEGDYGDASLHPDAISPSGGVGSFSLRASTAPRSFLVRAQQGASPSTKLQVVVGKDGFGTVIVAATYGGRRTSKEIVASVYPTKACAEIALSDPDGGQTVTGTMGAPISIQAIASGIPFALRVRLAHQAIGCIDIPGVLPNSQNYEWVPLLDLPLNVAGVRVNASFGFANDAAFVARWDGEFSPHTTPMLDAMFPTAVSEGAHLVDRMGTLVPSASQTAFNTARASGNWDAATNNWLSSKSISLKSEVAKWITVGLPETRKPFTVALDLANTTNAVLHGFGSEESSPAKFAPVSFAWSADPNDLLALSGIVSFAPSRILASGALDASRIDFPAAVTVADALGSYFDCTGWASAVPAAGSVYPGCNTGCSAALCVSALASLWNDAREASTAGAPVFAFGSSAAIQVDATARPVSFSGDWTGRLYSTSGSVGSLGGISSGSAL